MFFACLIQPIFNKSAYNVFSVLDSSNNNKSAYDMFNMLNSSNINKFAYDVFQHAWFNQY